MSEKTNEWISIKDRFPDADTAFWGLRYGRVIIDSGWSDPSALPGFGVTHWQPIEKPAPPKSEAERAFEKWERQQKGYTFEDAFIAGFEAGKGAKG